MAGTADRATRVVYSTDNSIYRVEPADVVVPRSVDELVAFVRRNHESAESLPIVPRGGGTGTNGQSLTDGVVVDVKRYLHGIESVDPHERTAVVQPGVVAAELNAAIAGHGLVWAPHTSTLDRATVGGMISTDAAGKGSLVHGRTHRHVVALDLCLADGAVVHLSPTTITDARTRAASDNSEGRLWRSLLELDLPTDDAAAAAMGLPRTLRGWTGYGVDRTRRDDMIDPVQLVVGAEGTLGVVTRAWLRLTELPTSVVTVVAVYDDFASALDASIDLAAVRPHAIEAFDEATLAAARRSPAWSVLDGTVGDGAAAVLLLDVESTDPDQPADGKALITAVDQDPRCRHRLLLTDPGERRAVWRLRADAVGLLAANVAGSPDMEARPTAFVEDCAVPVESMAAFIDEFRGLLDDAGLEYGMFGHADVGCVHVRPAIDLTHPDHADLVRSITDRVIDLVAARGGVLWGEHGRGFRGEAVGRFVPPEAVALMERVKAAFDPGDLWNPGKLYRPSGSTAPLVPLDAPPLRADVDRSVPVELRRSFHSAFACNGNAVCHDLSSTALMCPSYQATRDPARSPKGRADLIRTWLAEPDPDDDLSHAIDANLRECLSCAACSGTCPVRVDVPELKSRFLERFHERRRRSIGTMAMSRLESLAPIASRVPPIARIAARVVERPLGLVDLPTPERRLSSPERPFEPDGRGVDVVLLPDVFTSILEPRVGQAAVDALRRAGYTVALADYRPSGKFDHVVGRRDRFRAAASAQHELVGRIHAAGARPVVVDPAISLLHGHEYPAVLDKPPGPTVFDVSELLVDGPTSVDSGPVDAVQTRGRVTLLGHCTEEALAAERRVRWAALLARAGYEVVAPDTGCCGMAGAFGHERAHLAMSRDIWNRAWSPVVTDPESGTLVATGWSCRTQAARFAGRSISHPVELL